MKEGKWESQALITKLSEGQTQHKNVDATLGGTTAWNSNIGFVGDVLATKKSAPEAAEQVVKLENGKIAPENLTQQKTQSSWTNNASIPIADQKKNSDIPSNKDEAPSESQRKTSQSNLGDKSPKTPS